MGPVLFNLCVVDMNDCLLNCTCLQYADDSTIYQHSRVQDLKTYCVNVEKDLSRLLKWSTDNYLPFNATKTNLMLLTMAQMKACHKFDEIKDITIKCMEKQLELVTEWKLLGATIDRHLD